LILQVLKEKDRRKEDGESVPVEDVVTDEK